MTTPVHRRAAAPGRRRRGPLRRWLETRGLVGGHERAARTVRLRTADGVRLAASHLAGPSSGAGAVVLVHGFAARRSKPAYAYLADELSRDLDVLTLDLRGHGQSGGVCTLGAREAYDVEAGLGWLRERGHAWVAAVGLSMGATAVLHAAHRGARLDGLVTISAASHFRAAPETEPMRRLDRVWSSGWGRAGLRGLLGVRVVPPTRWRPPPHPAEMVRGIPTPLLVVHGRGDPYFPDSDARELVAGADGAARLWLEPRGFGHAEEGVTPRFVTALAGALEHGRITGRFPSREEVVPT